MKQRIFRSLCITVFITLLLNTALSLFFYYNFYEDRTGEELYNECHALAQGLVAAQDDLSFLASFEPQRDQELRITLVDGSGKVLYDNHADAASMPNHGERPEIVKAQKYGSGSDERYSKTIGKITSYSAVRIANSDDVLRLARDRNSMFGIFLQFLPLTVVIAVVLFLLSLISSRRITNWLIQPIEDAADDLAQGIEPTSYEELAPFFATISRQQETINEHLRTLEHERDTVTMILENMEEGLVLLDKEHLVVAVNQSAMRFFTPFVMPRIGEHMIALSRNPELLEAVQKAEGGASTNGILENGHLSARYFVNPVVQDGMVNGTIILILDITAELLAQQVKEEFSANVSHELKTPLTSISGFAEMLSSGMVEKQKDVKAFSSMIYDEAQRLLKLIDDILRLSSLEHGTEDFTEQVDLQDLAQTVAERYERQANEKDIKIVVSETPVFVRGNEMLLEDMLTNLIENAIKYNLPGGRVQVGLQEETSQVLLSVSDTGIGIPTSAQPHIFERFYRVDKSHSKETGGTGLGLSIVKHIVRRHHGEIALESALGRGTTISIRLPKLN